MKKTVLLLTILLTTAFCLHAQNNSSEYRTAIGVKGYFSNGSIGGFNIKHFTKGNTALEGSLLFRNGFLAIEGIYEWHGNIKNASGLKWYVGPGAMLGFYTGGASSTLVAVKGTIGLDYKFKGAPIDIALDVNPAFNLAPVTDFDFYAGLAFRFAL